MKKLLYILAFIFLSSVISCKESYDAEDSVIFYLPDWPPADSYMNYYPQLDEWNISVTTSEISYNFCISPAIKCFSLKIAESSPISVIAAPKTEGIHFFDAAGAIYPFSNKLTWKNGLSSTLLKKLHNKYRNLPEFSDFISQFNWQKLIDAINQKASESKIFYNPWHVEQTTILEKISQGKFTASYLNVKNTSIHELAEFKEFSEGVFLSSYIPQNYSAGINELFSIKNDLKERFLLCAEKKKIAVTNSSGSNDFFSLTFYDLPIK